MKEANSAQLSLNEVIWAQLEPNWVILDENEKNSQNTLKNHKIWSLKLLGERYKGLKAF